MRKELSRVVLVALVVALSSMLTLPESAPAARKPKNISFYGNVAVVATRGGDYADPASAMADHSSWCGTPSATNPCLVKIMPGVYTVSSPVVMQPYIDIQGSGEMVTKITGALSSSAVSTAIVKGASHAELRFVTVENTGTGQYTIAIFNSSQSPSILHVTATASGGYYSWGVYNRFSSTTMTNVTATASSENRNIAVYNYSSSPIMTNVTATASDGTNNYGVYSYSSSPTMTNVTATASGGTNCFGVYNHYHSSPTMMNVTATASGGTNFNSGVLNFVSCSPTMTNVTATASGGTRSAGVYNSSSSPAMRNVTATASDGTDNYGVYNTTSSSPTMMNVTATASGGTDSGGVYNSNSGTVKINHSVIKGSTYSIYNDSGATTYVGDSQLDGSAGGTLTCVGAYDGSYAPLTCP